MSSKPRDQSYDVPEEAPEERTADLLQKLAKMGTSGVPVVGGPVAEFIGLLQPSVERRRDDWVEDIAHELNRVRARVKDLEDRDIYDDEAFVSAVLNASSVAVRTHQTEKREALRNAVLNSALRNEPDEDLQAIFLALVDRFTPWHLRVLKLFDNPQEALRREGKDPGRWERQSLGGGAHVLEDTFPELKGQREFYDQVFADLVAAGLMKQWSLHTTMTGSGLLARRTSDIGRRFLEFISAPDEQES
jgi:hypothetical protein